MAKSARTSAPVTAAVVRQYFAENPAKAADLSDQARKTVQVGQRGRLSPDAIKAFNKGRKPNRRYVVGVSRTAALARQAEVTALREAAASQGIVVKSRGRLPKAVHALAKA